MLTTNSVWIRSHLLFDNLIFATCQAKARRAGPGQQAKLPRPRHKWRGLRKQKDDDRKIDCEYTGESKMKNGIS